MAYLAKNEVPTKLDYNADNRTEVIFFEKPKWVESERRWVQGESPITGIFLKDGSIEKLIGKKITYKDKPIEY